MKTLSVYLTLGGNLSTIQRENIEYILVYNIHNNPIATIDIDTELENLVRKVEINDNENTSFVGWPIRFIEELVIFYDIDGNIHLVSPDKIKTFTNYTNLQKNTISTKKYTKVNFLLGVNFKTCSEEKNSSKDGIEPTRIISDKIRIHNFFTLFHDGFLSLKRLQQKTLFYSKPYLFENSSSIGLIYTKTNKLKELNFNFPFYFQWSNGKPYSSQGQYLVGSKSVEYLPSSEPKPILRADAKSHFFSATFVGNMFCLEGGSNCLVKNRSLFTDFFTNTNNSDHKVYTNFNYLALTSFDINNYSFGAGFYYPIYGIWGDNLFREIYSSESSPMIKIEKSFKNTNIKLTASKSRIASKAPTKENITMIYSNEMKNYYAIKTEESNSLLNSLEQFMLNLYYKISIFILLCISSSSLFATQLVSIHIGSCQREIGIILNVDDSKIDILNLEGNIRTVKRFDIIYMAHYPMSNIKIAHINPTKKFKIVNVKTLYNNKVTPLLKGWMTNYHDNKISFLTTTGLETVIDVKDIWDLNYEEQKTRIVFQNSIEADFNFIYPYPFISCEKTNNQWQNIYPQHLFETPILIKKELDKLEKSFALLKNHIKEKKFYPKPQLYTNKATLAAWVSTNQRYGSSKARNSNFIPVVTNELSEGLYKFQRVILTGTAPMDYSIHEEPQTQFLYKMKSSYFHLSFMTDLNQLIIDDYKWKEYDLDKSDHRYNEKFHIAAGFDYQNYAIEYGLVDINYGLKDKKLYHSDELSINRIGLFYKNRFFNGTFYYGKNIALEDDTSEEDFTLPDNPTQEEIDYYDYLESIKQNEPDISLDFETFRINFDFPSSSQLQTKYSFIYNTIDFKKTDKDVNSQKGFIYKGSSFISAIYFNYTLPFDDLYINSYLSYEKLNSQSGISSYENSRNSDYLKSGVSVGLVF